MMITMRGINLDTKHADHYMQSKQDILVTIHFMQDAISFIHFHTLCPSANTTCHELIL